MEDVAKAMSICNYSTRGCASYRIDELSRCLATRSHFDADIQLIPPVGKSCGTQQYYAVAMSKDRN
jgi:hypothetical protein